MFLIFISLVVDHWFNFLLAIVRIVLLKDIFAISAVFQGLEEQKVEKQRQGRGGKGEEKNSK